MKTPFIVYKIERRGFSEFYAPTVYTVVKETPCYYHVKRDWGISCEPKERFRKDFKSAIEACIKAQRDKMDVEHKNMTDLQLRLAREATYIDELKARLTEVGKS